jgi:predicted anti-sigma-YlaC factor YlaD
MMKTHYSEADLLETYYMQPGESMPVMMHLANCRDCAARYEALERKLREAASCSTREHPETFWTRQRIAIQRKIAARGARTTRVAQVTRVAAAAVLAFFLGGVITWHEVKPTQTPQVIVKTQPVAVDDLQIPHDPWQDEELSDFHNVVHWESWQ